MFYLSYVICNLSIFFFQVAVKNNIDVFYFSTNVPIHVFFTEDGEMEKRVFLATWKDIPAQNEVQYTISNVEHNAGRFVYCILYIHKFLLCFYYWFFFTVF